MEFVLLYAMQLIFFFPSSSGRGEGSQWWMRRRRGIVRYFTHLSPTSPAPHAHPTPTPPSLPPFIVQQLHTSRFVMDLAARCAAPRQKTQRFKKREREKIAAFQPPPHKERVPEKNTSSAGEDCGSSRLHDVNVNAAQRFVEG